MDLARRVETQARWPDGSNVRPLTRSISTTTPDGKQHGGDRAAPGDSHGGRRASVCACSSDGLDLYFMLLLQMICIRKTNREFFFKIFCISPEDKAKRESLFRRFTGVRFLGCLDPWEFFLKGCETLWDFPQEFMQSIIFEDFFSQTSSCNSFTFGGV